MIYGLRYFLGFPLGATVQAKTKGIWGWCCPHPFNSNKTVLLLDTEGIGDVEKVSALKVKTIFNSTSNSCKIKEQSKQYFGRKPAHQ